MSDGDYAVFKIAVKVTDSEWVAFGIRVDMRPTFSASEL